MNRRELIAGAGMAAMAAPLIAQEGSATAAPTLPTGISVTANSLLVNSQKRVIPPEEKRAQYAICKERGHRPTIYGNDPGIFLATPAVFIAIPDAPPKPYPQVGESEWQTCWYCGARWRFVTKMEEEGAPE